MSSQAVERLVGQLGPDTTVVVGEPDEGIQHLRGAVHRALREHSLAEQEVRQEDLHRHRAPPQRITGPVVAREPHHHVDEVARIVLGQLCGARRSEEPVDQLVTLLRRPLRPLVAGSTLRQLSHHPFDQRAAGRPRLGLERWIGDRRQVDRLGQAGACVGRVQLGERGVRFLGDHLLVLRLERGQRFVDHERVLDERPHVVVHVGDDRHRVVVAGPHVEHDVVAVTQDVRHLDRSQDARRVQSSEPARRLAPTVRELASDATLGQLVRGQCSDRLEQRRCLGTGHLEERPQQLVAHVGEIGLVGIKRIACARIDDREQRAGPRQQRQGMAFAQRRADRREPTDASRSGSPRSAATSANSWCTPSGPVSDLSGPFPRPRRSPGPCGIRPV